MKLKTPAMDPFDVEPIIGTNYPAGLDSQSKLRERRRLGDALGLTNFGVNLTRLPPGSASALRHWHLKQDEFVYILLGEVNLVTDEGSQVLTTGMVAGFPAGKDDGHHLVNESDDDVWYLEVGDRPPGDDVEYPDVDLRIFQGRRVHKDGTPYD